MRNRRNIVGAETKFITPIYRLIENVTIEIHISCSKPCWIRLHEPANRRRVEAVAVIIEADFGQPFPPGEGKSLSDEGRGLRVAGSIPDCCSTINIIRVRLNDGAGAVGQVGNAA